MPSPGKLALQRFHSLPKQHPYLGKQVFKTRAYENTSHSNHNLSFPALLCLVVHVLQGAWMGWLDLILGSWRFDLLFFSPFSAFCNECRSLSISNGCGQLYIYFLELESRICNIHCFPVSFHKIKHHQWRSSGTVTDVKVFRNSDWCQSSAQIQPEWHSHCCHDSQALLALISFLIDVFQGLFVLVWRLGMLQAIGELLAFLFSMMIMAT